MDNDVTITWKPVVAGFLDIVIGIIILCMLFIFGIAPMIVKPVGGEISRFNVSALFLVMPGIIISSLDIIGGILAIRRRRWRWALACSITAAISPTPLGIAAVVLILLSRNEFK